MNAMPQLQCRVRLYHSVQGGREILGFADLTIAGSFVIKDIGIIKTANSAGPFLSFPSKKGNGPTEGKYYDVAHPITAEAYKQAVDVVLEEFKKAEMTR